MACNTLADHASPLHSPPLQRGKSALSKKAKERARIAAEKRAAAARERRLKMLSSRVEPWVR